MITKDFVKECLDILDIKYTEVEDGRIAVSFYDEETFPCQIVTFINIIEDNMITFNTQALDYHPEGVLLMMANRHNCRCYAPACSIDSDGDINMDRAYIIDAEVSPHYILDNVIKPGIFLPLDAFIFFELTDEEIEARRNAEK